MSADDTLGSCQIEGAFNFHCCSISSTTAIIWWNNSRSTRMIPARKVCCALVNRYAVVKLTCTPHTTCDDREIINQIIGLTQQDYSTSLSRNLSIEWQLQWYSPCHNCCTIFCCASTRWVIACGGDYTLPYIRPSKKKSKFSVPARFLFEGRLQFLFFLNLNLKKK